MVDKTYKYIIIDDDDISISNLQYEVDKYAEFHNEGVAKNGAAGLRLIERVHPDLVFLDVELPDMQGMDLLSRLKMRTRDSLRVVFYTAHSKYLIDAVRNQAYDYLMKPVEPAELKSLFRRMITEDAARAEMTPSRNVPVEAHTEKKFMIMTPTGDLCFIRTNEIGFFRYSSERKIWETMLSNGKMLPLKRNVTAEQLCRFDPAFMQVHQSFIINVNYLMMVQDNICLLYPPFEKENGIILSKKCRKVMMDRFGSL